MKIRRKGMSRINNKIHQDMTRVIKLNIYDLYQSNHPTA